MKTIQNKLSAIALLAIIAITTLNVGCKKDAQVIDTNVQELSNKKLQGVENCTAMVSNDGFLSFESEEDLNEYYKFLETHNDQEIDELEARNGFMSYSRKVETILREYEILNENKETKMEEILSFRKQYEDYLKITDEDFFLKIEGLGNRIVNQDGYVQIANNIFKYEGTDIYNTDEQNLKLLKSSNYSSNLISKSETKIHELKPRTRQVNQWQQDDFTTQQKCGRWHRTYSSLKFYASGPSTPGYGQTGLMYCSAGFSYYLKNMKRGWTGVWYGQSRASRFQGYHHASYNGYVNFNHPSNSVTVSRTYNSRTWSAVWNNDPWGAQQWANGIFNGLWAYVAGTVTYDVCGTKTYNY